MPERDAQILIAGGGPAGLAVALTARRRGLEALIVDRAHPPIDKACGEGLMPDGLDCLRRFGVELGADRFHPFRGIRYVDGEVVAEGRFPGVYGAGIRRLELHRAMVRRAEEVGVRFAWGTKITGLTDRGFETEDGELRGEWLVAADGLRSHLRQWAGLAGRESREKRFGVRRHFAVEPWNDFVEVHWGKGCEAYVTPVGPRQVGLAFLWSGRKASFDDLLEGFPALKKRFDGAEEVSRDRGMGPLRQRVKSVVKGRLALVGDASGYVDAITGEGLSLAFHQAEAVIEAIEAEDLSRYAQAHRKIGLAPDALTKLMLWVEHRPWLRRRMVGGLARDPELFDKILAIHCRAEPVTSLGWSGPPRLLWDLVRA